jgi:hypothetical protein
MSVAISFAAAVVLDSSFLLSHYTRRFTANGKQRWEAVSAGVAVAYMFVLIVPELEEHRPTVAASVPGAVLNAEKHIYMWTLAGFVAFVGLSRLLARFSLKSSATVNELPFWGQMAGYSAYLLLIGYLLVHREDQSVLSLALFDFAMGLHLLMLDTRLVDQCRRIYKPWGRSLLMASVLVGWALGALNAFPESLTSRLFAFIVGAVVVMSAEEELPSGRHGRFWWFAGGAFSYAILLMLL